MGAFSHWTQSQMHVCLKSKISQSFTNICVILCEKHRASQRMLRNLVCRDAHRKGIQKDQRFN